MLSVWCCLFCCCFFCCLFCCCLSVVYCLFCFVVYCLFCCCLLVGVCLLFVVCSVVVCLLFVCCLLYVCFVVCLLLSAGFAGAAVNLNKCQFDQTNDACRFNECWHDFVANPAANYKTTNNRRQQTNTEQQR